MTLDKKENMTAPPIGVIMSSVLTLGPSHFNQALRHLSSADSWHTHARTNCHDLSILPFIRCCLRMYSIEDTFTDW